MTTEGCKSETDNLWFSSITSILSHLLHSKPTVPCASYRKYLYLVLYMQRQCPIRHPPSAAVHTQHRLLIYYGKFLHQCLKITLFEIQFTWFFSWEPADEYLYQGKGGKIQTIVRFSVQTLIILNLVSWNGLHRSNGF